MDETEKPQQVHAEATVALAHVHMKRRYTANQIEYDRVDVDLPDRQVDIPKLKRGGVKVIWLSEGSPGEFAVDPDAMWRGGSAPNLRPALRSAFYGSSEPHRMLRGWDAVRGICRVFADDLELATTVGQALEIVRRGKIAVFLHTEALLVANDLAVLRAYHAMGLRCSGLVHGAPLDWIDSDLEQREPGGLTDLGRRIVSEMNALGMVIDVSHASERAVFDVIEVSDHPIVASHSNARALCPLQRNVSDAQIRGIAKTGGVIGVHVSSALVDATCRYGRKNARGPQYGSARLEMIHKVRVPGALDPFAYEVEMRNQYAPPTDAEPYFPTVGLDKLVDHVDYLVDLVGVDHVGIGTDLQFLEDPVEGFGDVSETPNLTGALLQRGYSAQEVKLILGDNLLRVMREVFGE